MKLMNSMLSFCNRLEMERRNSWALVPVSHHTSCPRGMMKIKVDSIQYFLILAIKICATLGCPYVGSQAKIIFHILGSV